MGLQAAIGEILAVYDRGGGVHDLMRGYESKAGRIVIKPGERPWLRPEDWHETVVVSQDRDRIRLVAIWAKRPGTGALTRTVAGIIAADLTPVIVEPTREMRETCRRWGWKIRNVGCDFDSFEEQWRPRFRNKKQAA